VNVGVPKESTPGERRVAVVPEVARALSASGAAVHFERGAGAAGGFLDREFEESGARPCDTYGELAGRSDLVLKVQPPNDQELPAHSEHSALISLLRPLDEPGRIEQLAARHIDAFALELMPRITRAQSMDVLSSQSTIAGYRAVIRAADALPRIFPMLVTAAGTLQPARVLVLGAGVAGLQALATARRLGAVTAAYDTRAAVREQVESVGARFVELDLEGGAGEDAGGYAASQSAAFYDRQREELAKHVSLSDVVITTALVPGESAPRLITAAAVHGMRPGSVIVDLAAEKGGNCDRTVPGEEVVEQGVRIIGSTNLPAEVPAHASQLFAKNVLTFFDHLVTENGALAFDLEDEITAGTLVSRCGEVVNDRVCAQLAKREEGGTDA
jgi:NAD(P) transhydrogenase subunit alpha